MFEVGRHYRSNNDDKLLCKRYDEQDKTWMFVGEDSVSFVVIWARSDGRLPDYPYLGPIIKGPWEAGGAVKP